ncbi:MAG: hypothetical protein A2014_09165 [Spirochaetes bacterium GWF1_49_6]|nr:MAG: hypothetical protein A2014_09165 [Spirochaetes bacterium GWF1_49_6]
MDFFGATMKCFNLKDEIDAVIKEILDYKWLESEKAGHDIGMSRAAREWINSYYDEWFHYNCERFLDENHSKRSHSV